MDEERYWSERDYLDDLLKQLPVHVFWKNRDSVFLGCNEAFARGLGLNSPSEIVGKTDYDLPVKVEQSYAFRKDDQQVIASRQPKLNIVEEQIFSDGRKAFLLTNKTPLLDKSGELMGVLCVYYDITELKEAQDQVAQLKVQNEIQKQTVKEQQKFTNLANQVAHDIRSPLASLMMIVKSCKEIPEADRIALREAAISIGDIAENLLNNYQNKTTEVTVHLEQRHPLLVSAILLQVLTDKKYQYKNLPVKFDYDFSINSHFAFIKTEISAFKQMLSNLINNAVDAFDGSVGIVRLKLVANNEWVKIIVQDDGKGIPPEILTKIVSKIAVTSGKKTGHGIGLIQVHEMLARNQGELDIDSEVDTGTTMTVTLPRIKAPHWIAEEINLNKNDIIIILDDDISIHKAWDARFKPILQQESNMQLHHFQLGDEALKFIDSLPVTEKQRVYMLADYELLKQKLNGLQVIANSQIERSLLVTSHFGDLSVREQAAKTGTKILPKQMASEIIININEVSLDKTIDIVIVDDDEMFVCNLVLFAFADRNVDTYYNPEHFLKNVSKYHKETKFYLDNQFAHSKISGLQIAKQLHAQGYQHLYILTGEHFKDEDKPSYAILIEKNHIDKIKNS